MAANIPSAFLKPPCPVCGGTTVQNNEPASGAREAPIRCSSCDAKLVPVPTAKMFLALVAPAIGVPVMFLAFQAMRNSVSGVWSMLLVCALGGLFMALGMRLMLGGFALRPWRP